MFNMRGRVPGDVLMKMHYGSEVYLFIIPFLNGAKELYKNVCSKLNKEPDSIKIKYLDHEEDEIWLQHNDSFNLCTQLPKTPDGLPQYDFNVYDIVDNDV